MKTTPQRSPDALTHVRGYWGAKNVLLAANQEYETSAIALMIVWLAAHSKTKTVRIRHNCPFSTENRGGAGHLAHFLKGLSSCESISVSPTAQISTFLTVGNCRAV